MQEKNWDIKREMRWADQQQKYEKRRLTIDNHNHSAFNDQPKFQHKTKREMTRTQCNATTQAGCIDINYFTQTREILRIVNR